MTATLRAPRKTLPGVITKSQWLPPKMCIFGLPGIGKSTFGSGAPNPIFIPTEAGVENLDIARFPVAKNLPDFLNHLNMVANEEHDHGAVVIDTLNGLVDLYYQDKKDIPGELGKDGKPRPKYDFTGFGGYGGWSAVSRDIAADIFEPLSKCQQRGMYVILLAHTGEYIRKNPIGEDLTVAAPSIPKWVWKSIHPWLDVIGRADYLYNTKSKTDGFGKTVTKAATVEDTVDGVKYKIRKLIFDGGAEQDCKARVGYELPPDMDLSWDIFASYLGNIKELAKEIRELWHFMPEERMQPTLEWLGVNSLEQLPEASRGRLSQIRNRLLELKAAAPVPDVEPAAETLASA